MLLDFLSLERITGECIGQTILKFYEEKGINILDCRGQCYDGAPNMQSLKKGAASYILKESPKAYTTHCCSHSLNLSLASTCKIPIITNIVEIYKSVLIYIFQHISETWKSSYSHGWTKTLNSKKFISKGGMPKVTLKLLSSWTDWQNLNLLLEW